MPDRETLERAQQDAREGKSPSTQAGEFVREEIRHIREGKHGARSPQQAIAIGLSEARRAGVKLGPPKGPAAVRKELLKTPLPDGKQKVHYTSPRHRSNDRALRRGPSSGSLAMQPVARRFLVRQKSLPSSVGNRVADRLL
jgi:Family of unknown function (DUF6496)